ncbi:hypothetical protein BDB01DRAFT_832211 [Pilobolus umbonatus]|nr:hypothetical protein BDB01DRAFT_832211 [Pilobolus umbonatus]
MNKLHWSSEYLNEYPLSQQYVHSNKVDADQPSMIYPVPSYYSSAIVSSPSASPIIPSNGIIYSNESFISNAAYPLQHQPGSPDSFMSGVSPTPVYQIAPPALVKSSSSSTMNSTSSHQSSANYLSETIAKASALPESFYPEFLQYSKESFEQTGQRKTAPGTNSKKRNRSEEDKTQFSSSASTSSSSSASEADEDENPSKKQATEHDNAPTVNELRRQIHIQSEQKRRAQIKDGFEDLRTQLPACLNKKMSKVTLLHRTVQHIQHLKSTQMTILAELERLVQENEQLRNFQQSVLQKQAIENMYSIGSI